jgi:hypothetical protein
MTSMEQQKKIILERLIPLSREYGYEYKQIDGMPYFRQIHSEYVLNSSIYWFRHRQHAFGYTLSITAVEDIIMDIGTPVNDFSSHRKRELYLDTLGDLHGLSLRRTIEVQTVDILSAWKLVKKTKSTGFRKDFAALRKLAGLLNNADFLQRVENIQGIEALLRANARQPCKTCDNSQAKTYLRNFDYYLDDVAHLVLGKNAENFHRVVADLKNTTFSFMEGAAHAIKVIHLQPINPTIYEAPLTGCRADAREGTKIIEFKSWKSEDNLVEEDREASDETEPTFNTTKSMFFNFRKGYVKISQFLCYLRNISNMTNLEYYFDAGKITNKTTEDTKIIYVKECFRDMMYNTTTNQLTAKGTDVFNTIFGNVNIRATLFDLNSTVTPQNQFIVIVADLNNGFYNFINVR